MGTLASSAQGGCVVRWTSAVAAAVGVVLGGLGRGLPDAVVAERAAGRSRSECGDEGIVECAVVVLPEAVVVSIGDVFLLVGLYTVSAVCGAALLAFGFRSSIHSDLHPRLGSLVNARSAIGPVCVLLGASLLVPATWVIASALASG